MDYPQKTERYCRPCEKNTTHMFAGVQPTRDSWIEYSDGPQLIRNFRINYDCLLCKAQSFDVDMARVPLSKLEASLLATPAAGDKIGSD